jgi:hypothetical protein
MNDEIRGAKDRDVKSRARELDSEPVCERVLETRPAATRRRARGGAPSAPPRSREEDERIAFHEAGHAVAAHLLGGRVGAVSIKSRRAWAGVAVAGGPVYEDEELEQVARRTVSGICLRKISNTDTFRAPRKLDPRPDGP